MIRRTFIAVAGILATSLGPGLPNTGWAQEPTPPATQPLTPQQIKDQQQAEILQHLGHLPQIGPMTAHDVVRVETESGRLVVDTALPPAKGDRRVQVQDDPGIWRVVLRQRDDDPPIYLVVERYDFSDPDELFFHSLLTASNTQVSLSGSRENVEGMMQVELLDRSPIVSDEEGIIDPGGMRLFVSEFDAAGHPTVRFRIEAPDLPTLRREHPDTVNRYLRPVLQSLHIETLLSADPEMAWQVLGDQWEVDPQVVQQVQALLPRFDSDDFADREAAVAEVQKLGHQGALALLRLDRTSLTPEQNARVDQATAEYQQLSADRAATLRDDPNFLLDVLLSDEPPLRALALKQLAKQAGGPVAFDLDAPAEQRAQRVAALRAALHPHQTATRPTNAP